MHLDPLEDELDLLARATAHTSSSWTSRAKIVKEAMRPILDAGQRAERRDELDKRGADQVKARFRQIQFDDGLSV